MANSIIGSGGSYLFVGNSFTFGRVDPVMSYNTDHVRDLTSPAQGGTFTNTTGSNPYEPHPWGGVPGLFQAFASQSGLELDVAISARNAATLQGQYLNSNPAGWDLRGNVASQSWDTIVLQDNSTQPLPSGAGSITFAANSSTATLVIHPTADTKVETDETIGIQVTGSSSYRTSSGVVTGTILNDDPTGPTVNPANPTVTLVASPNAVAEDGAPNLVYTFTRTGPTTSALTVNFAAARDGGTAPSVTEYTSSFQSNGSSTTGSLSFTSGTGSIVIKAGASSATFTIDPIPDSTVENDESVRLTLSSNANYNVGTTGAVSATILNDDFAPGTDLSLANISLSIASSAVYEDGSGNLVYQFTRSGSNAAPLTVNFSVSGTATLAGNDFTVTGANSFSSPGAADPNLQSFQTYAVKLAQYATTGSADGAVPANTHANAATNVFLYETWARPNMITGAVVANTDDTTGAVTNTATTAPEYYLSLEAMTADLRAAYEGLAAANPIFAGVAPVGAAFLAAVQNGTAIRDPYTTASGTTVGSIDLWWDDNLHASKYGSYLSSLTLFGTLTGLDPRSLGAAEHVASDLGITQAVAAALQNVAAATLGFTLNAHWTAPGQVTELPGGVTGLLASEGSFGFSDSDIADTHTIAVAALTPGSVGTFSAAIHTDTTGDGTGGSVNWLFTVDNTAVAFLAPGESRVEHFLVTISDANGGSSQRDVAVTLNGTYDDPPVATITPASYAVTENATLNLKNNGLSVRDVDANNGSETVTLSVTDGILNVTAGTSGAVVTNSGTNAVTITGTIAQINALLVSDGNSTVSYVENNDNPGTTATLSLTIHDSGSLSSTDTAVLNITQVNDAPGATITPASYNATEQTSLDLKNSGLVSDIDGNAGSETVTLSVGEGVLNVTAGGSGATVNNSGTNTVTITGSAAQINALLTTDVTSTVSYIDNTDTPGASTTLSLSIHDNGNTGGGDQSSSASATINIAAVNDAPVLGGFGDTPAFVENGASVLLDTTNNMTVSDPELNVSPNKYEGATLTIARSGGPNPDDAFATTGLDVVDSDVNGDNVSLDGGATFIGKFIDNGDGSISFTFNATATAANINTVMRHIVYSNSSENPDPTVQVDFTFDDGNGQPGGQPQGTGTGVTVGSVTVQIAQVDDAPVLLNVATGAAYSPGSAGVVLSSGLGVFDVDATAPSALTGIASATIKIDSGFLAGDGLFVNLATSGGFFIVDDGSGPVVTNISVASNAGGILVLSGQDTTLHYQLVLDTVSYFSTAADPSNGGADPSRTITWQVNDGALNSPTPNPDPDNLVNTTILHFDTAPTVDLDASGAGTGFTTTYTENQAPIAIVDTDVTIVDPDTAALESMTIVLTNAKAGDALSIAGALPGGISSSIDTSVAGKITVHLTNSASLADYQTALGAVRFASSSEHPDTTDRDITVVASEGDVDSNPAHATIHVVSVNDPPINTVPGPSITADATDLAIAGLAVSDPDAVSLTTTLHVENGIVTVGAAGGATIGGSGTATVTLSGSVAQIDAALGAANNVVYRSALNFNGTDHLTMTSDDGGSTGSGGALHDIDTVDIHVAGIHPVLTSVTTSGLGITAGSGDLNAGHVVTLTANFNEAVIVDTAGGTPTLSLNDGGVAAYTSGSGSSALNFNYTVAAGQNTSDLAVTAANLNGGAVHDAIGHTASLSAAVGNPAGTLQIDTLAPHLTDVSASIAGGDLEAGSAVNFVFKFDESVKVTGGTPTLTLNNGGSAVYDAAATSALGDASKLVFDYVVDAHDAGTLALAINDINLHGAALTDLAGNAPGFSHVAATFGVSVGEVYAPPHLALIADHGFVVT